MRALEGQPRAQSNDARVRELVDPTEDAARGDVVAVEGRVRVEDVEHLPRDGQARLSAESDPLGQPEVEVPEVGEPLAVAEDDGREI